MPHTNDPDAPPPDPAMDACLAQARNAVLNVLVGVGVMIAVSGWLIRRRAREGIAAPTRGLHDGLLFALIVAAVASYLVRRAWARRPASLRDDRRLARFYWSHVGAAAIAAFGVPLGLAYGWFVDPRLEGVAPFWIVPLALGLLSIPRRGELDSLPPSPLNREAPSS
jgi:hypothetical protein